MAVQIGIIVILLVIGVLIYRAGARLLGRVVEGEVTAACQEVARPAAPMEPIGPVGPDGLMVLFADRFVDRPSPNKMVSPRSRCYAPLTDEELDPQHWTQQILYATLVDLYSRGCIELRASERAATLMPPYPQKTWELELRQVGPMPESPVSDVIAVAFGLLRKRRRGQADDDEHWVTLDAVVEQALKTIRQEMSFWQRAGVFGDIRLYVESALIAQGYLIEPGRPTWLDRVRSRRPEPHEEGVRRLERDADELAALLTEFRRTRGGNMLPESGTETEALRQVDTALLSPGDALDEIPLDEMLRISIYETLMAIRQLEPSGDAGV